MTTNDMTATSPQSFQQPFNQAIPLDGQLLYNHSSGKSKAEISKTLSWYQNRIQILEQDKQKLSKHIDECYDYIEQQTDKTRRLKEKLQKMNTGNEGVLDSNEWVSIPRSLVHKAIIMGLMLYALGVLLSMV